MDGLGVGFGLSAAGLTPGGVIEIKQGIIHGNVSVGDMGIRDNQWFTS
jgi:hypothetical protein